MQNIHIHVTISNSASYFELITIPFLSDKKKRRSGGEVQIKKEKTDSKDKKEKENKDDKDKKEKDRGSKKKSKKDESSSSSSEM